MMSSTIITRRLAGAFRHPRTQETIWCLFESTYESNVTPRTPHWGLRRICRLEDAMKSIFADAGECESGMLTNTRRTLTPEGHIKKWLFELRHPRPMPNMDIRLNLKDLASRFYVSGAAQIKEFREAICSRLEQVGKIDIATALARDETVLLRLHEDIELILALTGWAGNSRPVIACWTLIAGYTGKSLMTAKADSSLVSPWPRHSAGISVPYVRAFRLGTDHLILKEKGAWRSAGPSYSIVRQYVQALWKLELKTPGSYAALIPAYRSALKVNTLPLPEGSTAVVDLAACHPEARTRALKMAEKWQGVVSETTARIPFVSEATSDLIYELPCEAVTWEVPEDAEDFHEA